MRVSKPGDPEVHSMCDPPCHRLVLSMSQLKRNGGHYKGQWQNKQSQERGRTLERKCVFTNSSSWRPSLRGLQHKHRFDFIVSSYTEGPELSFRNNNILAKWAAPRRKKGNEGL